MMYPLCYDPAEYGRGEEDWLISAGRVEDSGLSAFMRHALHDDVLAPLLRGVMGCSPFLTRLLTRYPETVMQLHVNGAEAAFQRALHPLQDVELWHKPMAEIMRVLRVARAQAALVAGLADLRGEWVLDIVTAHLSQLADLAVNAAVNGLLSAAAQRGEITLGDAAAPGQGSGLIILSMGKLGAHALNYSSDIDLIVLFEPGRLRYAGRHSEQHFMNRLAQDLVHLLQERTGDGYVFRTDLRLRPDPASTPPAVSVPAAMAYYESVGQNWERAAMIKARPLAGDIDAGEALLKELRPFIWRRSLDFAAITDIHSIKRQMDSRTGRSIALAGHHVKLGAGGIREIEFYTQVHQLIWGGKLPQLRLRGTRDALNALVAADIVKEEDASPLLAAYPFLRTLEHRLQMIDDQQTHTVPQDAAGLLRVARFMGFEAMDGLEQALLPHLHKVHSIFASSFRESGEAGLGQDTGTLVFTGVGHDPETLATLTGLGYQQPEAVADIIMSWHRGTRRPTRTKRARELLTELMPQLLTCMAETTNPDAAFLHFDTFLQDIPAGVQLFSLFHAHPSLMKLMADIMGSAPSLATTLKRHPALLESVLYGGFYDPLPDAPALNAMLAETLAYAESFEEAMDGLRRFKHEREFQAGVQLLQGMTNGAEAGAFLTRLAELVLTRSLTLTEAEFVTTHGRIPGGGFAVIGLGRLGSGELAFDSDLDLVFVYEATQEDALSEGGRKALGATVYYNRLAQRLVTALTAISREGVLYEIDTRLRPSGGKGMLAVSREAFSQYFAQSAWTFEHMALTKGRVVAGDDTLVAALSHDIHAIITAPREAKAVLQDVKQMRWRLAEEFPPTRMWDLKHTRGGLMEADFLCQYLLLAHGAEHSTLMPGGTPALLPQLHVAGLLSDEAFYDLHQAYDFLTDSFHLLRLGGGVPRGGQPLPPALIRLLCDRLKRENETALETALIDVETRISAQYDAVTAG